MMHSRWALRMCVANLESWLLTTLLKSSCCCTARGGETTIRKEIDNQCEHQSCLLCHIPGETAQIHLHTLLMVDVVLSWGVALANTYEL